MNFTRNLFLFLILIGAAFLGLGLGIVFKFKGTTAGSDIVAAIMQKKYGVKPGQAIMIIDFMVIISAGFIIEFKGLSADKPAFLLTLYALFLLFISARIVDAIIRFRLCTYVLHRFGQERRNRRTHHDRSQPRCHGTQNPGSV